MISGVITNALQNLTGANVMVQSALRNKKRRLHTFKKKIILYVQIQCDIFYVQTKRKCFVYSNLCKRKTDCNALPLCVCVSR